MQALALRAGTAWTVIILDGTDPTVEKRSAPIGLVFESLRPKGYHRETFAGRKPNPLDAARIAELKSFVETSMKQLGIPGVSMALIDRGKVVYEGGFGVRELGKPERVDEEHRVHGGVEYQRDDDAAAFRTGRREEIEVG